MPRRKNAPPEPRIRRPYATAAERGGLPAKITCPRCGRPQWAGEDGSPRYHLTSTKPGDPEYREDIPVMTECGDRG